MCRGCVLQIKNKTENWQWQCARVSRPVNNCTNGNQPVKIEMNELDDYSSCDADGRVIIIS